MRKVLKYAVPIKDETVIEMPLQSKLLSAVRGHLRGEDVFFVYALVDTDCYMMEKVKFFIVGTGNPFPNRYHFKFIATEGFGHFVWHLFMSTRRDDGCLSTIKKL